MSGNLRATRRYQRLTPWHRRLRLRWQTWRLRRWIARGIPEATDEELDWLTGVTRPPPITSTDPYLAMLKDKT